MVFINRERHIMQILVLTSGWRVYSRTKEETVVPVITVDGHDLREITEELSVVGQKLDLVAVIRIHNDDVRTQLTIGLRKRHLPL